MKQVLKQIDEKYPFCKAKLVIDNYNGTRNYCINSNSECNLVFKYCKATSKERNFVTQIRGKNKTSLPATNQLQVVSKQKIDIYILS